MLSGDILYRWFPLIGEGLIWIGTIGQLLFASVRISALWKDGTFEQKSTLPPFYLPSVATNFTSASSLAVVRLSRFRLFVLRGRDDCVDYL